MRQVARVFRIILVFGFLFPSVLFGSSTTCGGAQTDGEEDGEEDNEGDDEGGGSGDFAGTWTYVELLDSLAPTDSRCPCGLPGDPDSHHNDPSNCDVIRYTSEAVVDSSGNVTVFGNDTWGTIDSSGAWSGSPEEEGYVNGAVNGTCTSTSCSGTFTADYVTDSGGADDCYDGTFTMTKD